jgi:hypothetical protein
LFASRFVERITTAMLGCSPRQIHQSGKQFYGAQFYGAQFDSGNTYPLKLERI